MIVSVGIDIVDVDRMSRLAEKYGERLAARLLGPDERNAYNLRADKSAYLAGRFAAKEAIVKALGKIIENRPPWNELEVVPDLQGRPSLKDSGNLGATLSNYQIHVSLSHERHHAVAVAVLSEKL